MKRPLLLSLLIHAVVAASVILLINTNHPSSPNDALPTTIELVGYEPHPSTPPAHHKSTPPTIHHTQPPTPPQQPSTPPPQPTTPQPLPSIAPKQLPTEPSLPQPQPHPSAPQPPTPPNTTQPTPTPPATSAPQPQPLSTHPITPTPQPKPPANNPTPPPSASETYSALNKSAIVHAIMANRFYPPIARRMGWEGTTILRFDLLPNGEINNLELTRSSGYAALDRASLETIRRAVDAMPKPSTRVTITVPIEYQLN
ncbi:MAG: energy transducer TonB [Campylobacterales bacterium]